MISHRILLRIRNEKVSTHIICPVTFSGGEALYEIMWENTVETDRPQITI
jgi:hypothetical protein